MKKLILFTAGGLALLTSIAVLAQSTQAQVTKEGDQYVLVGSLVNKGEAAINFDKDSSGPVFQGGSLSAIIDAGSTSTFKVMVPKEGFKQEKLSYGNQDGGCMFELTSGNDSADSMVSVDITPSGGAKCEMDGNNFIITISKADAKPDAKPDVQPETQPDTDTDSNTDSDTNSQ